jgi:GNAT superfamily N-acetyltransferase
VIEPTMLHLRPATATDVPVILALIRELAIYEREPDAVIAAEADLLRDGFGERPAFHVLLAEWRAGGPEAEAPAEVVGFAFYFYAYSTWVGRESLHLEDLFVLPSHRGRGIGLGLMRALARTAVERGCRRFQWQVLDWNAPAIRFYESLGARVLGEWQSVRIEGEALEALASGAGSTR